VTLVLLAGCGGGKAKISSPCVSVSNRIAQASPMRRVAPLVPPANAPARSVSVPVLTYHQVKRLPPGAGTRLIEYTIEPEVFAGEMRALKQAGYHSISQQQLFDALYRGAPLPSKPVLISVDDGWVDDVERILPVLQRERLTATFFVPTSHFFTWHTPRVFMNADQVRRLDRAGMDIGGHTQTHANLTLITAAARSCEIAGARAEMQRVLGHPVYFFAYPFSAYDDTVIRAVRDAGFTMAYTTAPGTQKSTTAPLTMPRIHVGHYQTPSGLVRLLGG
jgi:peptidoglycan/xylan/chitin deacetylase (PgdA/CDA1 family)